MNQPPPIATPRALPPRTDLPFPKRFATARLSFAPPSRTDRDTIFHGWASDPQVTRHLAWRTAASPADLDVFFDRADRGWATRTEFTWLLSDQITGEKIGAISLRLLGHRVEFGYVLRAASWNHGYITEALRALVPLALALPDIHRVGAFCDVENLASARVLEKAGFVREGLLLAWIRHPQAGPHPRDCWSYGLRRPASAA